MYSIVLLMALNGGVEATEFGHRQGCNGCTGTVACSGVVVACNGGSNGCHGGLFRRHGCNGNSCDCSGRQGLFSRHRGHGCNGGCNGVVACTGTTVEPAPAPAPAPQPKKMPEPKKTQESSPNQNLATVPAAGSPVATTIITAPRRGLLFNRRS